MADCEGLVFDKVFIAIPGAGIEKKCVQAFKITRMVSVKNAYGIGNVAVPAYGGLGIDIARGKATAIRVHADFDAVIAFEYGPERPRIILPSLQVHGCMENKFFYQRMFTAVQAV
jgi:hypothetical protein